MNGIAEIPSTGRNWIKTGAKLTQQSLDAVLDWQQNLGEVYSINLGPMGSMYGITEIDIVQQILQLEARKFKKSSMYDNLALLTGKGLVTNFDREHWIKQRRMAQMAFHKTYLESIYKYVFQEIDLHLEDMASRKSQTLNWDEEMLTVTANVVTKVLLGSTIREEKGHFSEATQFCLKHCMDLWKNPFYKFTQHLNGGKSKFQKEKAYLTKMIQRFIDERRHDGKEGKEGRYDLLTMLMEAQYDDGTTMPDQQLLDEILTMFVGGHETSAHALSWAAFIFRKHPETLKLIREEADAVFDDTRESTFDDYGKLRYTRMVIDEILRLHPSAWTVARTSTEPVQLGKVNGLGKIIFPANTQFMIPIHAIHRNPKYWDKPNEFIPERFKNGIPRGEKKYSYIPFGAGASMCIGWNFALIEMTLTLARFAQRFDLEVHDGTVPYEAAITVQPKKNIKVAIHERVSVLA